MQLRSVAEPNPSRKYCPLRTDIASSPGPPSFLPLSVFTSFFYNGLTTPPQRRGSFSCALHRAGVVDDTRASSPSRASRSCSFITVRRSLPACGHYRGTMGTVVPWSVRILLGGLIATVRSVNSRVSAWESEPRSEREDLSFHRRQHRREDSTECVFVKIWGSKRDGQECVWALWVIRRKAR